MTTDLRRHAQCTGQAMIADLGTSYRAGLALDTVFAFQNAWNELLPSVRGIAGVILPSRNNGQLVVDGLYGAQSGSAANNFIANAPPLPSRASGVPAWVAQNHGALENMCPPAPQVLPVPPPITTAPTPTVPIAQAFTPPPAVAPPPPPPPATASQITNTCHGMWLRWLQDNPQYAPCLRRTDETVWMDLCKRAAIGQITFAQGAAGWGSHVHGKCGMRPAGSTAPELVQVSPPPASPSPLPVAAYEEPIVTMPGPPQPPVKPASLGPIAPIIISAPSAPGLLPEAHPAVLTLPEHEVKALPPPWIPIAVIGAAATAAVVGGLYLMRRS